MAKKNEILLSIALEGDADVKAKLKAIGEEGKRSLSDLERNANKAGSSIEKFTEPLSGLQKALAPLTDAAGISLGGGLLARLFGAAGPAAAIAGVSTIAVHLARVSESLQRNQGRLKALGDSEGFERISAQAKQLGTDVGSLQPRLEKFNAFQQRLRAGNTSVINPPNFEPGQAEEAAAGVRIVGGDGAITPPSREAFQGFDRALFEQIRKDVGTSDQAHSLTGQFEDTLFQNGKLSGDALRGLQGTSPNAANFLTKNLSPFLGRGFANPNDLATQIDRGQVSVGVNDLINETSKRAPEADKQADAARGVTQAFDGLKASAGRLDEAVGKTAGSILNKSLTGDLDRVTGAFDQVSGFVGRHKDAIEKGASIGSTAAGASGIPGSGAIGGVVGAGAGIGAAGISDLLGLLGQSTIGGFLTKALTDPGALQEKTRPLEGPSALQPQQQPQPAQPTEPPQPVFQSLLDNLGALLNSKPNLNVEGPSSNLGIRGDASEQVKEAGTQLASAIAEVAAEIKNSGGAGTVKVQAAGGGMIRRLDGGGHVRGPGTTTSDSIPAMLSDEEYVIKAQSARKLGRSALDWINIKGELPGFAQGGQANPLDFVGSHDVTYDPDSGGAYIDGKLYFPGDPVYNLFRDAIEKSKAAMKDTSSSGGHHSQFIGRFGYRDNEGEGATKSNFAAAGGPIGHWARGGAVGFLPARSFPHFAIGGPAAVGGAPGEDAIGAGSGSSPWADVPHLGSIDLTTNHGNARIVGPEDTLRQMSASARDAALAQTGPKPSWYR